MSRRDSLPKSKSLMNMDLTMRKSMTAKSDKDPESKNMETTTDLFSSVRASDFYSFIHKHWFF